MPRSVRHGTFSDSTRMHKNSHPQPTTPRSFTTGSEIPPTSAAGRNNTDMVVLEILYKIAELVILSRVNLQSESDHHRGARRARFNLDIEEIPMVREAMEPWRQDLHLPLVVDIYLETEDQKQLLERWNVVYTPAGGGNRDMLVQLREVCKKASVMLRVMYCVLRQLPSHWLVRQRYPPCISYAIHSQGNAALGDSSAFEASVATSRYSFAPIQTPYGYLKVVTVYREDCEVLQGSPVGEAATKLFQENVIIQDYVPQSPQIETEERKQFLITADRKQKPSRSSSFVQSPLLQTEVASQKDEVDNFDSSGVERRRRSTPARMDAEELDAQPSLTRTKSVSQPMAIPSQSKPTSEHEEEGRSGLGTQPSTIHPHSYGDPDRLRSLASNPNVTAAPYGYRNVAVESISMGNEVNSGRWHGSEQEESSSSGFGASLSHRLSTGSYQDHSTSPHPLSTPPRHPNSLALLNSSRTMLSTSGVRRSINSDYRASLENFSLDATAAGSSPRLHTIPSNSRPAHPAPSRKSSFNRLSGSSESPDDYSARHTSPKQSPGVDTPSALKAHAPSPPRSTASSGFPMSETQGSRPGSANSSPLFDGSDACTPPSPMLSQPQVDILSTSPAYAFARNPIYRAIKSSAPLALTGSSILHDRLTNTTSRGSRDEKSVNGPNGVSHRTFTNHDTDTSAGLWGVSPDTPDAFGLALLGGSRSRVLSSSSGEKEGSAASRTPTAPDQASSTESSSIHGDYGMDSELLLPFAMNDLDSETSTVSESGTIKSSAQTGATASVGQFLQQLKRAPRLQTQHPTPHAEVSPVNDGKSEASCITPFDAELVRFQRIREELQHHL